MSKIFEVDSKFWNGKKVFITGHTGFKGAWATIWLHRLGAKVFGYSLPSPTSPSLYESAKISDLLSGEKLDNICNNESLLKSMIEFQPEIVLHMAAQPLVRYSYDYPVETYMTNVMGTVFVLESVRKIESIKAALVITTDKCYENFEIQDGYSEEDRMGGYDPYSSSKGCAELVVAAWRRSFFGVNGKSIATARAGNVIGGGDWALDRLVPDFIRHFSENRRVSIRSPNAIRPWQHVLEPLSGYFKLLEKLYLEGTPFAESWNFGPLEKDARDVKFIAERLVSIWGDGASWDLDKQQHQPHEAKYLKLSITKAIKKLGWQPTLDIDEALNMTCQWYKKFYLNKDDSYQLCIEQITSFEEKKNHEV